MTPVVLLLALSAAGPTTEPQTGLWQVAPGSTVRAWAATDKPANTRALILVPGLHLHPLRPVRATRPEITHWQLPKSELVKALAKDFDVFAFGYAQTVSVDEVARSAGLRHAVADLRHAGYTELVLVGHSAGGIISRLFAEQNPEAGVTRVVAVASVLAAASHIDAMEDPDCTKAICELAKGKIARWSPDEVSAARKVLFGDTPTRARR